MRSESLAGQSLDHDLHLLLVRSSQGNQWTLSKILGTRSLWSAHTSCSVRCPVHSLLGFFTLCFPCLKSSLSIFKLFCPLVVAWCDWARRSDASQAALASSSPVPDSCHGRLMSRFWSLALHHLTVFRKSF